MGDEKVIFKLPDAIYHILNRDNTCLMIDIIDPYVSSHVEEFVNNDLLLIALQQEDQEDVDIKVVQEIVAILGETNQGKRSEE